MRKIIILFGLLLITILSYTQDSLSILKDTQVVQYQGDWKIENKIKNKFWGNSTYLALGVTFAKRANFDISLGRTSGVSHFGHNYFLLKATSWGAGYGFTKAYNELKHTVRVFYEFSFFPSAIIGNMGLRGDYIYNINDKQHYFRPSAGWSFIFMDVLYSYSFLLNNSPVSNLYKHGITLRLKYFHDFGKWEYHKNISPH